MSPALNANTGGLVDRPPDGGIPPPVVAPPTCCLPPVARPVFPVMRAHPVPALAAAATVDQETVWSEAPAVSAARFVEWLNPAGALNASDATRLGRASLDALQVTDHLQSKD